jgi:anti-anti-sigma factor
MLRQVPTLHHDPEVRRGIQMYADFADANLPAIAEAFARNYASIPAFGPMMAGLAPDRLLEQNRASMVRIRKGAFDDDWSEYIADLEGRGRSYAQYGIGFGDWSGLFAASQVATTDLVFARGPTDRDELRVVLKGVSVLFDTIVQTIGRTYFEAQQQAISEQAELVLELSTPVLELGDGVLLVPLVGQIDARRGERLQTAVLGSLRDRRARRVILDLTGVAVVDSYSAGRLMRAAEAARLMGASLVLCGLSSDLCITLVGLGVDFAHTRTFNSLADALHDAQWTPPRPPAPKPVEMIAKG